MARLYIVVLIGLASCDGAEPVATDASADGGAARDAGDAGAGRDCPIASARDVEELVHIGDGIGFTEDCTYAPGSSPALSSGIWDTNLAASFQFAATVENGLDQFAVVEKILVRWWTGDECGPVETKDISTLVPAMGADVIAFVASPSPEPADTTIALFVALESTTQSGGEIISPTFEYSVSVCTGCLQNNLGPCAETSPPFQVPCLPGQDEAIDCCEQTGGTLQCPPPQ